MSGNTLRVKICDESSCPFDGKLLDGQSTSAQSGTDYHPVASISYPMPDSAYPNGCPAGPGNCWKAETWVYSNNPGIGEPWIDLESNTVAGGSGLSVGFSNPPPVFNNQYNLSENESNPVTFENHSFLLHRDTDSDYKELTMTAQASDADPPHPCPC